MRIERVETFVLYPDEVQEFRRSISPKKCIVEFPDTKNGMRKVCVVHFSNRPNMFKNGFRVHSLQEAEIIKEALTSAGAKYWTKGLRFFVLDYGKLENAEGLEVYLWYRDLL